MTRLDMIWLDLNGGDSMSRPTLNSLTEGEVVEEIEVLPSALEGKKKSVCCSARRFLVIIKVNNDTAQHPYASVQSTLQQHVWLI